MENTFENMVGCSRHFGNSDSGDRMMFLKLPAWYLPASRQGKLRSPKWLDAWLTVFAGCDKHGPRQKGVGFPTRLHFTRQKTYFNGFLNRQKGVEKASLRGFAFPKKICGNFQAVSSSSWWFCLHGVGISFTRSANWWSTRRPDKNWTLLSQFWFNWLTFSSFRSEDPWKSMSNFRRKQDQRAAVKLAEKLQRLDPKGQETNWGGHGSSLKSYRWCLEATSELPCNFRNPKTRGTHTFFSETEIMCGEISRMPMTLTRRVVSP